MSPPSRWSGLKFAVLMHALWVYIVSTLAVEWIEIVTMSAEEDGEIVSTLAVEWIEIYQQILPVGLTEVSTLAVEWIEIPLLSISCSYSMSPPSRWSGLKYNLNPRCTPQYLVSTLAVEWIEIRPRTSKEAKHGGLHPRGGVD